MSKCGLKDLKIAAGVACFIAKTYVYKPYRTIQGESNREKDFVVLQSFVKPYPVGWIRLPTTFINVPLAG